MPDAGQITIARLLELRLLDALRQLELGEATAHVTAASDRRFGDYQTNVAMVCAKQMKRNPRELAQLLVDSLSVDDICDNVEIAGPGFLNFRLGTQFIWQRLSGMSSGSVPFIPPAQDQRCIVIDFSAPNVAKPMHVGHIRSTILGDALSRVARALGHKVVSDNHIGDWGTQFGKVIHGWRHFLDRDALHENPIVELVRLYRKVNKLSEDDADVLEASRQELVKLQAGDEENLAIWKETVQLSLKEFHAIYQRLDIKFDESLGESYYNDRLAPLCEKLQSQGIAEPSQGALCIFFPDIPELHDKPCLIRKSDGGYLYATTDLATLEYRSERWQPDEIWYVTGAPQQLHFQQIFAAAKRMGLNIGCRHIAFGSILGDDRKLMKTRSGDNVQLVDVLDEAEKRARVMLQEKNPEMQAEELDQLAATIGLGAVKFAELSQHRMTDYVFSWDRMLSLQGNTAPYLQNAYVRICSIFRKAGLEPGKATLPSGSLTLQQEERELASALLRFGEAVAGVLDEFRPNLLANYLYELATTFHGFYESCPVLKVDGELRQMRLALCSLTAEVLEQGLGLLGIRVPDRM